MSNSEAMHDNDAHRNERNDRGNPASGAAAGVDAEAPTIAMNHMPDKGRQTQVPLFATEQPASTERGGQPPYIQVPHERQPERPMIRKTGPSAATIVLATMMLFCGLLIAAVAMRFPNPLFPAMWANPAIIVAVSCAALGAILVFVAIAWAIAKGVHAMVAKGRGEKHSETMGDDDLPDGSGVSGVADAPSGSETSEGEYAPKGQQDQP